jgi:phosphoserine phosphatase RsbU/P
VNATATTATPAERAVEGGHTSVSREPSRITELIRVVSRTAMMQQPFVLSIALGVVAFVLASAAESALIGATGGNLALVAWTSEALLSSALVAATFLGLRVRNLQGCLSTLERSRIETETELKLAAGIQRRFLEAPERRPSALAWHARLQPARQVGGDFYDVLTLRDGSILIMIADVSGKGIPAALALASARAVFRQLAPEAADLKTLASALSRAIYADNEGLPYMTAILCQVEPNRGVLRYVNAGHPAGRLVGHRRLARLEPTGLPLGLVPDGRWDAVSLDTRGFTLGLLVTDGVFEAMDGESDADPILDDLARVVADRTPEAACAAVMQAVGAAPESPVAPPDDRTVVAFVPRVSG